MISTTKKEKLISCYNLFRKNPGWLARLERQLFLSPEEFSFLENHDEEQIALEKECEKDYFDNILPKVRKAVQDFVAEMLPDKELKAYRIEYLDHLIEKLKKRLADNYQAFYDSEAKGVPGFLREATWEINGSPALIRQIKSFTAEYEALRQDKKSKRKSYDEIQSALEKPTKGVVEMLGLRVINNMIKCPFHEDSRPSGNCKNNFFYCHACQKSLNNIQFLMDFKGISFPSAVEWLNTAY